MPELPEVETVVRDLRPLLVGRRILSLECGERRLRRTWNPDWMPCVVARSIVSIHRRGKWIIVELNDGSHLVVHLGMTGQFTVSASDKPRADHTHMIFILENGTELRFRDVRRFGSVEWFPDVKSVHIYLDQKLGPEPDAIDPIGFFKNVTGSERPVKAILLDQTVVAGIGNIYADEALHRSGLHPRRLGSSLSRVEVERLRQAIATVIDEAVNLRGSTIRDYIGGSGLRGNFQNEFRVYGRDGEPCSNCGSEIAVERIAGRSSHYCPRCQPSRRGK